MVDLGLDKLALIGAVALIVIGPEKLPKVARTVGHLLGKARRYVSDVKAEVSRSMEMDELNKARKQFEEAATEMGSAVQGTFHEAQQALSEPSDAFDADAWQTPVQPYKPPRKNWRLRRSHTPMWFKQSSGVKRHVQSGAARVARHRPKAL
ncbi:MAG: Sec-independent protein translocase protein TatB [Inhella sp.]|jgi:sec-independent protein translocase protein TatB